MRVLYDTGQLGLYIIFPLKLSCIQLVILCSVLSNNHTV